MLYNINIIYHIIDIICITYELTVSIDKYTQSKTDRHLKK